MPSRILLINFTKKEADKLSDLPLTIERGYLSDIKELSKKEAVMSSYSGYNDEEKRRVSNIDFYFPHPVYEYKALFLNLNNNSEIKKEFENNIKKYSEEEKKDFTKYWLLRGSPIVIFLGDYHYNDLFDIGIPDINLKKVAKEDITINTVDAERGGEMSSLFNRLKSEVIIPTHYYIQLGEKSLFLRENSDFKAKYIYWNNNNEDLAIFIDYNKGYSPTDRPRIVVLPQFRNNIMVVEKFLRQIAKLYPKYLPELPHSDWINSDAYYPKEVSDYDSKIQSLIDTFNKKIDDLQKEKEETKNKFKSLRGLLYQTGDELKESVINVFRNVFKITVIDADEENTQPLLNEDIIIEVDGQKILVEIKGVKSENPSPLFIAQVWKHISLSKDKDIKRGALILNHDLDTEPKDRHLAYKGEYEKGLNDIIFIDTRVIFNLGLAVIDYDMPVDKAISILFQKNGRVSFALDDYIKGKNNQILPEDSEGQG